MGQMVSKMQIQLKKTSTSFLTIFLKIVTGLVLGLTIALVFQEILGQKDGESTLSFLFIMAVVTLAFFRVARKWSLVGVLIFDLVCILVGLILRLYIMVGPGL